MMIHPTAIVHPDAVIAATASVGPYCTVGAHVTLADDVQLISHVVVDGHTSVGKATIIYPFATIGVAPQDLKYHGELSRLEIGEYNVIREHATLHLGTETGGMLTKIGNHNLLMVGVHIAHDCYVGNGIVMANQATLGGHVVVEDHVVIGGLSAVHQFVRIGKHAMIGGMSGAEKDIIPFTTIMETRGKLAGVNLVGMRRRGFSKEDIHAVRHAYELLKNSDTLEEKMVQVEQEFGHSSAVSEMLRFMKSSSSRGFCMPGSE